MRNSAVLCLSHRHSAVLYAILGRLTVVSMFSRPRRELKAFCTGFVYLLAMLSVWSLHWAKSF